MGGEEREKENKHPHSEYVFNKDSYLKGHRLAEEICYLPMAGRRKSLRHIKLTLNICHSVLFKTRVH